MATKTVLLTSGTTWTVPADLDTSVNITGMVIGGGGAGSAGFITFSGSGGGGSSGGGGGGGGGSGW